MPYYQDRPLVDVWTSGSEPRVEILLGYCNKRIIIPTGSVTCDILRQLLWPTWIWLWTCTENTNLGSEQAFAPARPGERPLSQSKPEGLGTTWKQTLGTFDFSFTPQVTIVASFHKVIIRIQSKKYVRMDDLFGLHHVVPLPAWVSQLDKLCKDRYLPRILSYSSLSRTEPLRI